MPEESRRGERGQRNGSGAFGHGRNLIGPPPAADDSRDHLRLVTSSRRAPLPPSADGLPPLDDPFWRTVDEGLARLDLTLSAGVRAAIDGHVRLLMAWNAQINLTALRTSEQIARGHLIDSLLAVAPLRRLTAPTASGRSPRPLTLIDLGSGAGFPGLPLALVLPAARAALVDSVGKKARFLAAAAEVTRHMLAGAGDRAPEITALAERAEDLADEPDHREGWDIVVARAVGSVAEVAELGLPLGRRGGLVVAWKHDSGDGSLEREVHEATRLARAAGGGQPSIERLPEAEAVGLPGHCLVVVEKRRPTPVRFPRPPGERRRSPLLP